MTNAQLSIAIGGLLLPVLIYFAAVERKSRQSTEEGKRNRIDAVINKYLEFRRRSHTSGFDGLLKSGVATLHSDSEIREAADKIAAHGEKDPLGRYNYDLTNVDLKVLFDYASTNKVNFHSTSIEDAIVQSGA